jgi:hypothetical protein
LGGLSHYQGEEPQECRWQQDLRGFENRSLQEWECGHIKGGRKSQEFKAIMAISAAGAAM